MSLLRPWLGTLVLLVACDSPTRLVDDEITKACLDAEAERMLVQFDSFYRPGCVAAPKVTCEVELDEETKTLKVTGEASWGDNGVFCGDQEPERAEGDCKLPEGWEDAAFIDVDGTVTAVADPCSLDAAE